MFKWPECTHDSSLHLSPVPFIEHDGNKWSHPCLIHSICSPSLAGPSLEGWFNSLCLISVLGILHKHVLIALFSSVPSFTPEVFTFLTLFFHLLMPSSTTKRSFASRLSLNSSSELSRLPHSSSNFSLSTTTVINYFLDLSPLVRSVSSSTGWPSFCLLSFSPWTSHPWAFLTSLCRARVLIKVPLLDYFLLIFSLSWSSHNT